GQRDQGALRIGTDLTEERLARYCGAVLEVEIPLRRSGDADGFRPVSVIRDGLLLHEVVPDDQAIDRSHRNQLVREVVPAGIDGDRPNAATNRGPQHWDLRKNQTGIARDPQRRLTPSEQP